MTKEEEMLDGTTTVAVAIGVLAISWVIVLTGAAYFNKNVN
ncbi:MAG TPA: hypothetical protein VH678_30915 [Xanthobacteraceae bacterium]|jgi:hypothetical protein